MHRKKDDKACHLFFKSSMVAGEKLVMPVARADVSVLVMRTSPGRSHLDSPVVLLWKYGLLVASSKSSTQMDSEFCSTGVFDDSISVGLMLALFSSVLGRSQLVSPIPLPFKTPISPIHPIKNACVGARKGKERKKKSGKSLTSNLVVVVWLLSRLVKKLCPDGLIRL